MKTAITGWGYAVPPTIRKNDDPIFSWLHRHHPAGQDLFKGYDKRRVLTGSETVEDIMVSAAKRALKSASITAADVGILTGYASVSEFITPNGLAAIHRELKLPLNCWVMPIQDDFTNALSGLVISHALVDSGQVKNALVICGSNWTQYSNYHTPQSISSADGAGAMIVGKSEDSSLFAFVDAMTSVTPKEYGSMKMSSDVEKFGRKKAFSSPFFHIDAEGIEMFKTWGVEEPPKIILQLLTNHGLSGKDITLFTHQASSVLLEAWGNAIKPAQYLNSLKEFANMTLASVLVNFAKFYDKIANNHVVINCVGPMYQTTAVLLKRNAS